MSTGSGWVDLGQDRRALEVPDGCIVESWIEDTGLAMVYIPGLSINELIRANGGVVHQAATERKP